MENIFLELLCDFESCRFIIVSSKFLQWLIWHWRRIFTTHFVCWMLCNAGFLIQFMNFLWKWSNVRSQFTCSWRRPFHDCCMCWLTLKEVGFVSNRLLAHRKEISSIHWASCQLNQFSCSMHHWNFSKIIISFGCSSNDSLQ